MPTFDQFLKFDLRIGTVVDARPHTSARDPALQLKIDFGNLGVKQSSAQITKRYGCDELVGRQVIAVVNFPARRIAGFRSDVLVLGVVLPDEDVVLLTPDANVPDGARIC